MSVKTSSINWCLSRIAFDNGRRKRSRLNAVQKKEIDNNNVLCARRGRVVIIIILIIIVIIMMIIHPVFETTRIGRYAGAAGTEEMLGTVTLGRGGVGGGLSRSTARTVSRLSLFNPAITAAAPQS